MPRPPAGDTGENHGDRIEMVTVKDIARAAGVSHTAVSAVLNGREKQARIGKSTAEKIRTLARSMKYSPNMTARSLRTGKSNFIGILIPAPTNNLFDTLLNQFQSHLFEHGYFGIYSFWNSAEDVPLATRAVLQRQVDGIITVAPEILPDSCRIPVISFLAEDRRFDYVGIDRAATFRTVIDYLYSRGYRRIAKPDSPLEESPRFGETARIFRGELLRHGLSPEWMFDGFQGKALFYDSLAVSSPKIADRLFCGENNKPDAVVMPNDNAAMALMTEAFRRGIRIPEDCAVIGADNIALCDFMSPPLTSVAFDDEAKPLAKILVESILERIADPEAPRRVKLLPGRVVERSSVGWKTPSFTA